MLSEISDFVGEGVQSLNQQVRGKYGGKFGATDAC